MARTTDEIVDLYTARKRAAGPLVSRMAELRDAYNADIAVPLPELDEAEKVAVANLIGLGLDQNAMRIASTMPDVYYPPIKAGSEQAETRAEKRRQANLGWWQMNRLNLKQRKRARWLIGYACAPAMIRPDTKRHIPMWHIRDPLSTFPPPPTGDPSADLTPPDCIFTFPRTLSWLRAHYPASLAGLHLGRDPSPDDRFDLVEYVDGDHIVLIVMGRTRDMYDHSPLGGAPYVELERLPNQAGVCTAVVPGRVTLDRPQGQFDGLLGMYQTQAKLWALQVIATQREIFPDEWLVGRPGEMPKIITPADGIHGDRGVLAGGDIKTIVSQPGPATLQAIDRLERNMRVTGAIPAEFGGESTTNVRTGRRGDAILSAAVDFPVQEAQELLAAALQEENIRAVAVDRAYFGDMPKSFYVGHGRGGKQVDYIPNRDFETDRNVVRYSHTGVDVNGLVIQIGQAVGVGLLSKRSAMEMFPLVEDPEREHDQIVAEGLEQAFLQGLQNQAAQGAIHPADLARIIQLVVTNRAELFEAVLQAQQEAQTRQATSGEPGAPDGPSAPGSPETQPGLSGNPLGQAGEAVPQASPSVANLANLLGSLRRPQMTLASEEAQQGIPA